MKTLLKKNNLLVVGLLVLVSIPALLPLFHQGFFVTDDGEWMVIRFSSFYQALHDGQFPVRFLSRLNFEYGYPVATFLYPGFMYAAVPLHLLKISLVDSIKTIVGISLVGSTLFTYLWLSHVFSKRSAAFIGAVVSLYLPYHLYDVYTRGSVGEVFALLFVPFILWMIERKQLMFVSLGIGALLIAHNTIALLFLPLLFLYAFFRKTISFKNLLVSFILGILLSSFFIIPAVFELSFTNFSKTIISNPSNYFAELLLIGVSTIIIFLLAFALFLLQKRSSKTDNRNVVILFLTVTFLAAFLSSQQSALLWHFLPSSLIQFPFRLLSYLVVSVAFLSAFIVSHLKQSYTTKAVIAGIVILCVVSSYQFMSPKTYMDKGEGYYSTNEATTTVKDEYMPMWVKNSSLQRPAQKVAYVSGGGMIINILSDNKKIMFTANNANDSLIKVNTIYWPGWNLIVDMQKQTILYNNPEGLIEFAVPKGTHQVSLKFQETPLRLFADIVSVISFVLLLFVGIRFKHK